MALSANSTAAAARHRLSGNLGVTGILFMVVAAAAPLTVIGSGVPLGFVLGNGVGFPAMYGFCAIVLLLFAVGLVTMAGQVRKPGAFFTFIGYGLGRQMGLAAAYLAVLAYTAIQLSVHAYLGYILSTTLIRLGGPVVPWWLFTVVGIALVGVFGFGRIDLSGKVLAVLLVGEVGVVLALVGAVVFSGAAPEGLSLAPFAWHNVVSGAPGVGLMFAMAAFIGFESTVIFRDEVKDPHRTLPRATYAALIGIGVFYILGSWGLIMAWGPQEIVAQTAKDPGSLILTTTRRYLGVVGVTTVNIVLITSMFACVLSIHNVIARYQHAMANAGILPGPLGRVHHKHASPHSSSIVQTATAAGLTLSCGLVGADPVRQVFTWAAGVATLAIAILMAVTGIAVMVYFAHTAPVRASVWKTVIAPALGVIGLMFTTLLIIDNFPMLLGDIDRAGQPRFGVVSWCMFGLIGVLPALGIGQARMLRVKRPAVYARILTAISESADAIATPLPRSRD
ncbi:MAG: APC family permease [Mycobacteriaceae bacterium]|nr:APC family permease [Mycobacteriaceae bacterium]